MQQSLIILIYFYLLTNQRTLWLTLCLSPSSVGTNPKYHFRCVNKIRKKLNIIIIERKSFCLDKPFDYPMSTMVTHVVKCILYRRLLADNCHLYNIFIYMK